DGFSDVGQSVVAQILHQLFQFGENQILVQFHADDAGGSRQHLSGRELEQFGQGSGGVGGNFFAVARGAVGVAGVDQHGADHTFRSPHIRTGQLHGGGLNLVLGEDGGSSGRSRRNNQREVVFFLFADSRINGRVLISK